MMKIIYPLMVIALGASLLFSCKKDKLAHADAFKRSEKAWQQFKSESNNSYSYKVTFCSWTGYCDETTIKVLNGVVTERAFVSTQRGDTPGQTEIVKQWVETVNELNTHPGRQNAITLDEVYREAKRDWLLKRKDAKTYFEAQNNGMISSCGYVENGCQDDCFNGIRIAEIKSL